MLFAPFIDKFCLIFDKIHISREKDVQSKKYCFTVYLFRYKVNYLKTVNFPIMNMALPVA